MKISHTSQIQNKSLAIKFLLYMTYTKICPQISRQLTNQILIFHKQQDIKVNKYKQIMHLGN